MLMITMIITILMLIPMNSNSHPILLIIMIIIYSMLMSLNMSYWKINFMYSIIMFLIMVSGLLIIFLYFSSLISNEQMTLNFNKIIMFIFTLNLLLLMSTFYMKKNYISNFLYNFKENSPLTNINEKFFTNISNLYIYPFNNITIMCIMFLLLSLFTIIKLSSMKSKPLRKISDD